MNGWPPIPPVPTRTGSNFTILIHYPSPWAGSSLPATRTASQAKSPCHLLALLTAVASFASGATAVLKKVRTTSTSSSAAPTASRIFSFTCPIASPRSSIVSSPHATSATDLADTAVDFISPPARGRNLYCYDWTPQEKFRAYRRDNTLDRAPPVVSLGGFVNGRGDVFTPAMSALSFGHDNPTSVADFRLGIGL